jgi:hypothetical protein
MASPRHCRLAAAAGLALLLGACGMPGAPQPPSLDLPRPPGDLRAARKGDRVILHWTAPRDTTDRLRLRRPGPTEVCRSLGLFPMLECLEVVAELPPQEAAGVTYSDLLPPAAQQRDPLGSAAYALIVRNAHGHAAGLSNQVRVPLAPTLAPPADLRAAMSAQGVVLTWSGHPHPHEDPALGHLYRIYRRTPGAPSALPVGEVQLATAPQVTFVDRTFEWEQTYEYAVAAVTTVTRDGHVADEVEGEDSAPVRVTARDVFPPAVPAGVQAVAVEAAGRLFVDLTWAPNVEADLAGYHVYRRLEDGSEEPRRLTAEPLPAPAFRDEHVQPGLRYLYSVSAVDVRGNLSARSAEAGERIPEARP